MSVAVITGASSGLGKEYVGAVINKVPEVDELWLIARRVERLEEVAKQYPQKAFKLIGLDLSKEDSFDNLDSMLGKSKPDIKLLVSNSAVVMTGDFIDLDAKAQMGMCDLNIRGATVITRICLPYMKRGSFILETSSASAFAPTPRMAVYCAGKSYLLEFSKALREELKKHGINVCAVCPGNMATEMIGVAQQHEERGISHYIPFLNVYKVAANSLDKARKGRAVYTPGAFYKVYRVLAKIFPHNWIMRFSKM